MDRDDPDTRPADDPTDVESELAALGMTEAELDAALELDEAPIGVEQLWEPDRSMIDRVTIEVERRLVDRAALATIVELAGLGWFTLQALIGDQNEP